MEHPFYEREYKPTEVQSLAALLPKPKNIYDMASAEIIGDKQNSSDIDQVNISIKINFRNQHYIVQ